MNSIAVKRNLLLRSSSTGQHPSANSGDWTGIWVCVGFSVQLTEVGAVLPATIGYHAAHVRRTEDGLTAAINARPFGGCMSIPVHCGSTRNVRCPQLACAFSEDGGVLDSTTDPAGTARSGFVGDGRRSVELPLAQWGPLLFMNITMTTPPPLPIAEVAAPEDVEVVETGRMLVSGSWLSAPMRAATAVERSLDGAPLDVTAVAPNLAMVSNGSDTLAVVSRPAGHTRSTLVWASLRAAGTGPATDPRWIDRIKL